MNLRIANSIRKLRRSVYKRSVSYFVFGILLISSAPIPSLAKGPTTKIVIESPRFGKPIEITDPAITQDFWVFSGSDGGTNSRNLIDWGNGVVSPPSGLESYQVSLYLAEYRHPYVVLYTFDRLNNQGYIYLPGRGDEWYGTNVSIVTHFLEGNWFRARARWVDVVRPIIEKQLTLSLKK